MRNRALMWIKEANSGPSTKNVGLGLFQVTHMRAVDYNTVHCG